MGSQTIYHKTRTADIVMNFAATENNLGWSFTAENDGELFDVILSNVASYTVNGSAGSISPTNPYSVSGGVPYAIAITKTTNGQSASITIKSRRAVNKTTTLSVPDFGAYTGRYRYVFLQGSETTVTKYDMSLFSFSAYTGSGTWSVNPVVGTITLPTLPGSIYWSKMDFVIKGGEPMMLVTGTGIVSVSQLYCCLIRMSDDTVWNLAMTVQNTYTTTSLGASYGASIEFSSYDYVNNKNYVRTSAGTNGTNVAEINISASTVTVLGLNSFADVNVRSHQFSPIDQQFISVGDYSIINTRNYNYKTLSNNSNIWGYIYDGGLNRRICSGITFGIVNFFNSNGAQVAAVDYGTIAVYTVTTILGWSIGRRVSMTSQNNWAIVDLTAGTIKKGTTALSTTSMGAILRCHSTGIFYATRSANIGWLFFDEAQATVDFGYYDFGGTLRASAANFIFN